ncbi:MAG TPA: hypothetical protein PKM41_00275 [Deltaproteobacteria bacterium]|nr:hypothetical protein [Deltaproteobacteria bacterium]HOI06020.1 hypothetical protein [Deltaproteobacteria bacterium]
MTPSPARPGLLLLLLACLCAPANAQTVFDVGPARPYRHVYELLMGAGHTRHNYQAIAGRGFHYANSYSLIYLANLLPGSYSIALSYPRGNVNLLPVVSVFDRWPYDPGARWYDLPMGPTVASGKKKMEYRWSLGVSPASTSTLLYITVEVPADAYGPNFFPHELYVTGPSSPMYPIGREQDVTFLTGPTDLVLTSGSAAASYVVDTPAKTFDTKALPPMPIPGDLVKNGAFTDGLNNWTPHRNRVPASDVKSFALKDGSLAIGSTQGRDREGVMQKVNADVSDAKSLILRADVKVTEQTQGGTGPEGRDAPMAIAVGYRDISGRETKKDLVFWKGFYALESDNPDRDITAGQKVPKGDWYRYIFDLMQLDPKPATILFISLEGSGWPSREGWVRNVHLIKSGGK